jgi:NADH-quinone oxidoreductase subunit L
MHAPILIILCPFLAALIVGFLGDSHRLRAYRLATLMQGVGVAVSFWALHEVGAAGAPILQTPFLPIPLLTPGPLLSFGLYIDRLAAVMMALISVIGLLISLFSIRYMQQDQGRARFHALLSLSVFVLLCMVTSQNLLMLFVFWQLLSFMIYLLSHNYFHAKTLSSAFTTYTLLRAGDVAFLLGIVLLYHFYGTLNWEPLFRRAAEAPYLLSLLPGRRLSVDATTLITLLIFIGAMSKSVQFPMNLWLPGALYAPTPVHALQHAGMINAGGFLLNRLAPLYAQSPATLHIVFAVGLLTTLLGSSMMLTQSDIKKTLGHSTVGQMGYMIMECGLGAFGLAIFHLVAHGFFKATLFLNSGNVIHEARREPRHPPFIPGPKKPPMEDNAFSRLTWGAGLAMTLILPLIILLAVHGLLGVPLADSHGTVILLFFAWVTSSQAILTLNRLHALGSWKIATAMFLVLLAIVAIYLFAAERFTHFLYPDPDQVALFFDAAALPVPLFDFLIVITTLAIAFGWLILYARGHQQSLPIPAWGDDVKARLYLLLLNRLYLEELADKLGERFCQTANRLGRSVLTQRFFSLIGFGMMPILGIYLLSDRGSLALPAGRVQVALRASALLCALYGSLISMTPAWTKRRLLPFSLAASSIFWWHLSYAKTMTPEASVYMSATGLILGGFFFVRKMLATRYGEDAFHEVGGLARGMPRFAFVLSLLVMAAMGLPPFGLFSGFIGMLLHPTIPVSWDLALIALTGIFTTGFFLNLMQKILFGPDPENLPRRDLSRGEAALLVGVVWLLLLIGVVPKDFFIPLLG